MVLSLYTGNRSHNGVFREHVIPRRHCHNYYNLVTEWISINTAIRSQTPYITKRKVLRANKFHTYRNSKSKKLIGGDDDISWQQERKKTNRDL